MEEQLKIGDRVIWMWNGKEIVGTILSIHQDNENYFGVDFAESGWTYGHTAITKPRLKNDTGYWVNGNELRKAGKITFEELIL